MLLGEGNVCVSDQAASREWGAWCMRQLACGMVCPEEWSQGQFTGVYKTRRLTMGGRGKKNMNHRARLWVRAGCWGGTSLTGKCWNIQQSDTVLPVPRIVSLFIGAVLNCTVRNCGCQVLMWGYLSGCCQGLLNSKSGCLWRESVQDGIIRQLGSFCLFGMLSDCTRGVGSGC